MIGKKKMDLETKLLLSEYKFFRDILKKYPNGVISLVSDSFDYWRVLTQIAPALKETIMNRQPDALGLAKVVFRPDSGNPVNIICGYNWVDEDDAEEALLDGVEVEAIRNDDKFYQIEVVYSCDGDFMFHRRIKELSEAEVKGSIEVLWDTFGGNRNASGYKELSPRVGLIYGDSITLQRVDAILTRLADKGFAASNVVSGIGSFSYQMCSRDSLGIAVKATWVQVNGEAREIYKDPKTDDGTKKSARGLLSVFKDGENYVLKDRCTESEEQIGELVPIFQDGVLLKETSLAEIRSRLLV
jgi:nicotinamide phosphoribosyltransferase